MRKGTGYPIKSHSLSRWPLSIMFSHLECWSHSLSLQFYEVEDKMSEFVFRCHLSDETISLFVMHFCSILFYPIT